MKRAFLRLAGLEIAENAVKLNWACAAQALSQITAKLRRLGEKVTLCFEIEIEGETKSMRCLQGSFKYFSWRQSKEMAETL